MNWIRVAALLCAIGVHAGLAFVLLGSAQGDPALQDGHGNNELTVAATVTTEDDQTFGVDRETKAEQAYVAPQQKEGVKEETVQKPEEPKLAEPLPAKPEDAQLPTEDKPPLKEPETPPPPPLPKAKVQMPRPQIDPEEEQRAASHALEGRRTKQASVYLSEVYSVLGRHKVRPQSKQGGRVLVSLTIAPSGQIISRAVVESSGSDALDRAAITSLERAAPFPPLPKTLSDGPYTLMVPFEYSAH